MEPSDEKSSLDPHIRHFIYTAFAKSARPPTTFEVAQHFKVTISTVEDAYQRLADAHHIALAPGSHAIWMAHPFSSLPTNYVTQIGNKKYWGN